MGFSLINPKTKAPNRHKISVRVYPERSGTYSDGTVRNQGQSLRLKLGAGVLGRLNASPEDRFQVLLGSDEDYGSIAIRKAILCPESPTSIQGYKGTRTSSGGTIVRVATSKLPWHVEDIEKDVDAMFVYRGGLAVVSLPEGTGPFVVSDQLERTSR